MSADQEPRPSLILPSLLLGLWCAAGLLDVLDDLGADGVGELAWEFAHGLPRWRKSFRRGWRMSAERAEMDHPK